MFTEIFLKRWTHREPVIIYVEVCVWGGGGGGGGRGGQGFLGGGGGGVKAISDWLEGGLNFYYKEV